MHDSPAESLDDFRYDTLTWQIRFAHQVAVAIVSGFTTFADRPHDQTLTVSAFGVVNGKTRFHDGASATGAVYGFAGSMDNLRIYNRAINEDETRWLFQLRLMLSRRYLATESGARAIYAPASY